MGSKDHFRFTCLFIGVAIVAGCTTVASEPTSTHLPTPPTFPVVAATITATATALPPSETPISLPPGSVLAGEQVATIKVGLFPQLLVFGEGAVWVPNAGSGTVSRIDPHTNEVVASIHIGDADPNFERFVPSRVTVGDGFVWAARNDTDSVVQIDPKNNEVVATIPIGMTPFALAMYHGELWVTSRYDDSVVRVDVRTQQVVATITGVNEPTAIVVTEDAVWVVNHLDDAITRIDPMTNQIVASVSLGTNAALFNPNCGSCVSGMVFQSSGIWVAVAVGAVVRIDPQTNQVVATIPTNIGTFGIVGDDQGIWFSNFEDQMIFLIDPQTNQIVGAIPTSSSLAFLASGEGSLWAATDYSDTNARNRVIRFDVQPLD